MKKKILKYVIVFIGAMISIIIYLSVIGLETVKFNKQIQDKIFQNNKKINISLKKIKLTLDPFNFRINAKTVGAKIIYQKKKIELEYIKTQISLISLIKNKFVSSNLKISTKSILLKDLVSFARAIDNKPELFFLELAIKKGFLIADVELNFDKDGNIKDDYKINGLLKEGKIKILKGYNFEKIDFSFNIKKNVYNFKNLNFLANKINLFSDSLRIIRKNKDFIFEGMIENKDTTLNNEVLNLSKFNFKKLDLDNINFSSKNNFSFKINKKLKLKDLVVESEIKIDEFKYKIPDSINNYLPEVKNLIYFKEHKIKAKYKKNNLSIEGLGKIQLQNKFDDIEYLITNKGKNFSLISNIELSKLDVKNQEFLKIFFPRINEIINLKKHIIEITYDNNRLFLKGSGKIKLENQFDVIDYSISKIANKFNFDTKLGLDKTFVKIDFLNFVKDKSFKSKILIKGDYEKNIGINLNKASFVSKNNQIILNNLLLDKDNKILKIDKLNLDYFDNEDKKNQFFIQRDKKNNYKLKGEIFNANTLISNLLKNKNDNKYRIFKNNIKLNLNIKDVYIDEKNIIKNLKGKILIKDNKIFQTNLSSFFDKNENLTFSINTKIDGEKITTLFSSRAKPLVNRYKFIKGYEEGFLDFYSSKKNKISNSKLKIYDFKLQKLPTLTKLLTLASLQGIADLLSGEGIRFNEFEMNFNNKDNLMTIEEIYAIGPAISILMNGYIEENKLISLRGTLVPATTINKTISSIPLLGKILVGDKTGEGVFGVSFKIKGSPGALETTVNPIKTLTPRFITRTLEKLKKN